MTFVLRRIPPQLKVDKKHFHRLPNEKKDAIVVALRLLKDLNCDISPFGDVLDGGPEGFMRDWDDRDRKVACKCLLQELQVDDAEQGGVVSTRMAVVAGAVGILLVEVISLVRDTGFHYEVQLDEGAPARDGVMNAHSNEGTLGGNLTYRSGDAVQIYALSIADGTRLWNAICTLLHAI